MKHKITNWKVWGRGLMGAAIGGAANAVTAMGFEPTKFNFSEGLSHLLWFAVASAVISACLYLKQSPVPPEEEVDDIGTDNKGV